MSSPAVTVLIAAYNKEDILAQTLFALDRQSFPDFEVVVCDDGSGPELEKRVIEISEKVSYPLLHTRHDDLGFRKCRILNKGVLKSRSDYLIVLDPDCIPHRGFIQGHMEERKPGYFLSGRRLMLGQKLSHRIRENTTGFKELESLIGLISKWFLYNGGRHLSAGIYLPRALRKVVDNRELALKGCNMSFWKRDIEQINGFEETFEVPCGGEDTDLERRFRLFGLKSKSVKHAAICYHLDHPLLPRDGKADQLCRELAAKEIIRAVRGLSKHFLHETVEKC